MVSYDMKATIPDVVHTKLMVADHLLALIVTV